MSEFTLDELMEELVSAEDFLDFFNVPYQPAVVHVNRLHILQRFHDYLSRAGEMPESDDARTIHYAKWLLQAYQDFEGSDALTEKVFKVFHMHEPKETFVSLDQLLR